MATNTPIEYAALGPIGWGVYQAKRYSGGSQAMTQILSQSGNFVENASEKVTETVGKGVENVEKGITNVWKEAKGEINFLAVLLVGGIVLTAWALSSSNIGKNVTVKAV